MVSTKVILIVSNSTSDIAEHLTEEFLKLGHKVAKVCETGDSALGHEIQYNTGQLIPVGSRSSDSYLQLRIDYEAQSHVDEIIPTILSRFGRLDVLINNLSHHYRPCDLLDTNSFFEFNKALQVDLYIPARVAQLAAPHLRSELGGGVIINIAPGTGQSPPQNMFRDMVKAGLMMLTKSLANSFESHNVRCLGIVSSPGKTSNAQAETSSHDHLATKISDLVKFLISGESNYVNATIIEININ